MRAIWGPLGKVLTNRSTKDLEENYRSGTYGATYTIPVAEELFRGGATTVYTYRLGTGGTKASLAVDDGPTITAKYPGAVDMVVSIAAKIGDSSTKVLSVYYESELVEAIEFAADDTAEGANLVAAATAQSKFVDVTAAASVTTVPTVAAADGTLAGGANPTITNDSYSAAFGAFEKYFYNTICLDVDDDANMTLSTLLKTYLDNVFLRGKLGIGVVGEKTTVAFATRLAHGAAFNDYKIVYLGGGWQAGTESKDGILAVAYTAGVIASTPANQGITHSVVKGATDLLEALTYADYEDAITNGVLMVSMSADGAIWYDSGIDTLINPGVDEDDGWKKIRRVKTRMELFDRLDRTLTPKVGRVSADTDGVADVIQSGQRVLTAMVGEGKLMPGPTFIEDPDNPFAGDSAWFIIQADDIDSLEKIYLHYMFRYSQNA